MNEDNAEKTERIAKRMARAGVCSRRDAEKLIAEGRVAVNGSIIDTPATKVSEKDTIELDGKLVGKKEKSRLWIYHKPVGLVTSHKDEQGRKTVFDTLPKKMPRVISVGRLDLNSEGLLLLTNDGEVSRYLEMPSTALERKYRVRAFGRITQKELDSLKDGVVIDGVIYKSIKAVLEKSSNSVTNSWIEITLTEGKNREIRKVLEHLGLKVNRLIRIAYGEFKLGKLPEGQVNEVSDAEMKRIFGDRFS